jgi:hypothetical protein
MRPRLGRRTRVAAALSAVAAAIVVAAVVAGAGSAKGTPRTLHLVGTIQKTIGFAPDHPPRQGDRFGGGSEITGDDTGVQRSVCTIIGKRGLCNVQLNLSRGRLSAQGLVPNETDHTPIPITGGTGAYAGARGTAYATQLSATRTRFDVRLVRDLDLEALRTASARRSIAR